ncbi:hypothetical protein GOP47_0023049 [Adiantum capillus-veneris]|uniref:Uncharacterized protein n=1 Tax=Adiantum capillus-veneris TaxID=13818 RepID=A0A9D4U700_ADICA|nr:hypothetical protein GOP47_0023049 [Adiantum capillus-veneris]
MWSLGLGLPTVDEKDAYIGWLKSEFAAANAIIDGMCQHMRSIGNPEDYDVVFSCLNKRRHAWTPTLYMQHFYSVADIVNSLEEVAQKKLQACCSSLSLMNSTSNVHHAVCQDQWNNSHMKPPKRNTTLPQCQQQRTELSKESSPNVWANAASNGNALCEAGRDGRAKPHSTTNSTVGISESCAPSCDNTTNEEVKAISTTGFSNDTGLNNTIQQASLLKCEGLDTTRLLNSEVAIASNEEEEARHALIKRSMQFQCCELEDGQPVNDGESGELCEYVFNSKEVDELVEVISQLQAAGREGALGCAFNSGEKADNKPDVIRFGPKHNRGVKLNGHLCMPRFLQAMIKWLTACGILSAKRRPDSCLISIFNEGDFEPPNTDQGAWERPVCVISLLGNCNMVFGHFISNDQQGNCKGPFEVVVPAGSVLLLQENFAGILQKAVPASPSRRITLVFGKALSTSSAGLSYTIAEAKARNKQWWGTAAPNGCYPGFMEQAKLAGAITMHPLPHAIPNHLNGPPLPSIQPVLPFPNPLGVASPYNPDPTVLQGWSHAPSRLQINATPGTGVFLPSAEVPTWQSGLVVSVTAGFDLRKAGHPKRHEKYVKVKGSFNPAMSSPKQTLGKLMSSPLTDGIGCVVTTST